MDLNKIIKTRDELLDNLAGAIECKDRVTERRYYRDAFDQYQNLITALIDLEAENKALRIENATKTTQAQQYFSESADTKEALRLAKESFIVTHDKNKDLRDILRDLITDIQYDAAISIDLDVAKAKALLAGGG